MYVYGDVNILLLECFRWLQLQASEFYLTIKKIMKKKIGKHSKGEQQEIRKLSIASEKCVSVEILWKET